MASLIDSLLGATAAFLQPEAKTVDATWATSEIAELRLASDQTWWGDPGDSEATDPTRRFAIAAETSLAMTSWLALEARTSLAHAAIVASHGSRALAPRWLVSGGATLHGKAGFVTVRARDVGDAVIYNVSAGTQVGAIDLELAIANALDTAWELAPDVGGEPLTAVVTAARAW